MNPKSLIIFVGWNNKEYIEKCLHSLRSQTFQNYSTIFVDNNSQDGSIKYLKNNFSNFPIEILPQSENLGFAEGNNIGIKYGLRKYPDTKYFLLLNIDTYLKNDTLQEFITEAEKDKKEKIGLWTGKMLMWDEKTIHSTGMMIKGDLSTYNRGMYEIDKKQYDSKKKVFGAIGAGIFIRRKALEKMKQNWMDERFFVYKEDDDICWKNLLLGYKAEYNPKAVIYHKAGGTTPKYSLKKIFYLERNRIFLLFKYAGFLDLLIALFLRPFELLKIALEKKHVNKRKKGSPSKTSMGKMVKYIIKGHLAAFKWNIIKKFLPDRQYYKPYRKRFHKIKTLYISDSG